MAGLVDRSRRPPRCAHRISAEMERMCVTCAVAIRAGGRGVLPIGAVTLVAFWWSEKGVLNCLCKRRVSQHGSPRSQYGCVIGARSFAQWAPPTASAFQPLAEVHEILNPSICNLEVAVERVLAGDRGEAGHKHNGIVGPVRKDPLAVR
jgi:hypothetical protein